MYGPGRLADSPGPLDNTHGFPKTGRGGLPISNRLRSTPARTDTTSGQRTGCRARFAIAAGIPSAGLRSNAVRPLLPASYSSQDATYAVALTWYFAPDAASSTGGSAPEISSGFAPLVPRKGPGFCPPDLPVSPAPPPAPLPLPDRLALQLPASIRPQIQPAVPAAGALFQKAGYSSSLWPPPGSDGAWALCGCHL